MASRILTFKTMKDGEYKLKDTTVLILTFEALDNDQVPVIWKRINLPQGQNFSFDIEYTGKLGVATSTTGDDVVYPGPFIDMKPGQTSVLGVYNKRSEIGPAAPVVWSEPTPYSSPGISFNATNNTGFPRDFSVGLITEEFQSGKKISEFHPALTWHNVADNGTIYIIFKPRMKIYAYSVPRESQILRGGVEKCLGTYDLSRLHPIGKENVFLVYTDETKGKNRLTVKGLDDVDTAKVDQ